jgi:adenylate kinase
MNILIFGPNGSGKGTQGAIIKDKANLPHVESGVIFRENISRKTELGKQAKTYIDKGELVPDEITIPMILDRLKQDDCKNGWLLDGFPRNVAQAEALYEALKKEDMKLDYVIEIALDREVAKKRIMGRRLCANDNNHPNNIYIEAIQPKTKEGEMVCRVCGGKLSERADDQDEEAINKRHGIYYDKSNGTLAAINFFKNKAESGVKVIEVDGTPGVKEVTESLLKKLGI